MTSTERTTHDEGSAPAGPSGALPEAIARKLHPRESEAVVGEIVETHPLTLAERFAALRSEVEDMRVREGGREAHVRVLEERVAAAEALLGETLARLRHLGRWVGASDWGPGSDA